MMQDPKEGMVPFKIMTEKELLKLNRLEVTALLAEKVMGWKRLKTKCRKGLYVWKNHESNTRWFGDYILNMEIVIVDGQFSDGDAHDMGEWNPLEDERDMMEMLRHVSIAHTCWKLEGWNYPVSSQASGYFCQVGRSGVSEYGIHDIPGWAVAIACLKAVNEITP